VLRAHFLSRSEAKVFGFWSQSTDFFAPLRSLFFAVSEAERSGSVERSTAHVSQPLLRVLISNWLIVGYWL